MEEFIPREDIKSYLMVFADKAISTGKLGHLDRVKGAISNLVSEMQKSMINLINNHLESKMKLFGQVLPEVCETCPLKYSETGAVTKKEYFYCIRTDNSSLNVPINCPEITKGIKKKFKKGKKSEK